MLQTHPCTPSDAPALATLYLECFTSPFERHLWPDVPRMHEWWTTAFAGKLAQPDKFHTLKVIDTENGEMVGFLEWKLPAPVAAGEKGEEEEEDEYPPYPEEVGGLEAWNRLLVEMGGNTGKVMGERRFYFLNILGTKPAYRRRGVASEMIRWGVDRADAEGVEAFVISAPMARPVYAKHGFELVLEGENLGGDLGEFVPGYMLRKPRGKQEQAGCGGYAKWLAVPVVLGVGAVLFQRFGRRLL
ncbi:GNAT family N-acetyltransferase [Aspergillus ibericus CBS 121593]|uniref:Acyl-CoA N-acyltransferase n=1 Tax=Aspergillus ibericus CBS 121593 TaxID=1448316 RepID=A0A395GJC1_9EURO|nr:acyl-CoA N-acyltransferase [Aspergillus ibericus CBS 121593]RAK95581.1 acyl-CoA N-acyltransferase [Aspergillus ibericus CBS 121593]